jgi:hypothetical protein
MTSELTAATASTVPIAIAPPDFVATNAMPANGRCSKQLREATARSQVPKSWPGAHSLWQWTSPIEPNTSLWSRDADHLLVDSKMENLPILHQGLHPDATTFRFSPIPNELRIGELFRPPLLRVYSSSQYIVYLMTEGCSDSELARYTGVLRGGMKTSVQTYRSEMLIYKPKKSF